MYCNKINSLIQALSHQVDGLGFAFEICTSYGHTQQTYRYTFWSKLAINASPDKSSCASMTEVLYQVQAEQPYSRQQLNNHSLIANVSLHDPRSFQLGQIHNEIWGGSHK